jgi:ATP-dependent helicase/nuclease subunit A
MSTHMSKGLQFPVVFVANCASSFNTDDYTGDVVISEEYAVASKSVDISTMSKIQSPAYHAAAQEVKKQLESEEMRLLYVAATRAENKLIFTANISKACDEYMSVLDVNRAGKKVGKCNGSSYLSWLIEALSAECDKVNDMQSGIIDYGDVRYIFYPLAYEGDEHSLTIPALNTGAENADEYTDDKNNDSTDIAVDEQFRSELEKKLNAAYTYEPLTKISAKFTATELAANLREKNGEENYGLFIGKPSFLTENNTGKLSGKRRGDAYHKLMEHIPFEKILSEDEISDYIKNSTAGFLDKAEQNSIDAGDIAGFYKNDVAKRIVQASKNGKLYREYPIFHRLDTQCYDPAIFGADSREMLEGAEPYVQGIADMFFIEDDGIVLVDYKTDKTDDEQKYKDDYKLQLDIYKEALEKEFSVPVKQMIIYSFTLGRFIDLEKPEENK